MPDPSLRLDTFLPYRLSVASNRVSDTIASTYRALFGLSIPEWRLIAVIAEAEGATQQALGQRTQMDKLTVSRAAIALAGRGLVRREAGARDRRTQCLSLTAAGHDLYADVAPKALELERQIFARFDAGELAAFTAMLAAIEQATDEVRRSD